MRQKKRFILTITILTLAMMLSGCANALEKMENQEDRKDAIDILDAIEDEDGEYIYNTYFNFVDEDDFERDINHIIGGYEGERTDIQFLSIYYQSFKGFGQNSNSTDSKIVAYLITTTKNTYSMTMTYVKEGSEYVLYGVNISTYLDFVVNAGMSNYTAINWILLVLNILSYGIMIVALILCIKSKIKLKWLWIILILIQVGFTTTNFPNEFMTNFSIIQLLGFSQHLKYAHGGTITSVFIHLFAVLFLFLRKSLINRNSDVNYSETEYKRITAEREERLRIEKKEQAKKEAILSEKENNLESNNKN